MSGKYQALQPQQTSATRISSFKRTPALAQNFTRSMFRTQTWMAMGGVLQLAVLALPIRRYFAAAPVLVYLLWTIADHALMLIGAKSNIYEADTIYSKYTALIPDEDGAFTKVGGEGEKIVVFMLGFRNNHILGPMAPGGKDMQAHAFGMFQELEKKADEFNFLGQSFYHNAGASATSPDSMILMYFKSYDDIIRYANSPLHRKGWEWFSKITAQYKHLGISHELYEVPAGRWENVYANIRPTGMAITQHKTLDPEGNERWVSPIVDARKGKLATTHGRYY